jgi:CheY-like chemotaxis protein
MNSVFGTNMKFRPRKTDATSFYLYSIARWSIRVESVSSGEAALRELAAADSRDPYQAVLMDWHMPGMDGLEASRHILRGAV